MFKRFVCSAVLLFAASLAAYATPTLGVVSDSGVYAWSGEEPEWLEYDYFSDVTAVPATIDGEGNEYEGFVIGPSGTDITLFTKYVPGTVDLYLMSNAGVDSMSIIEEDNYFTRLESYYQMGGYHRLEGNEYLAYRLPSDGWVQHELESTFYFYTAPLFYSGELAKGDYVFGATGDVGNDGVFTHTDFSPKTTSAGGYPAPEPGTLILLGIGLGGAGAASFRKRMASRMLHKNSG